MLNLKHCRSVFSANNVQRCDKIASNVRSLTTWFCHRVEKRQSDHNRAFRYFRPRSTRLIYSQFGNTPSSKILTRDMTSATKSVEIHCVSSLCTKAKQALSQQVHHDEKQETFYLVIDEGSGSDSSTDRPKLEYEYIQPDLVDLWHTFVPDKYRGLGLAKVLAKEALDYFSQKQDVKIRLSCTYLQKYVKNNPSPSYASRLEK